MSSAGQAGFTSDHWTAEEEKMARSSSSVTSVRKVFSWETTTARASVPMRNSIGSRPMAWQDATSLSLMARLALAMSVSPCWQKRSKPAPEPMLSMVRLSA